MSKIGEESALAERLGTIADPMALLSGLFAHAPVPFQICQPDGHRLLVNHASRELLGSEPPPGYSIFEDEIADRQGLLPADSTGVSLGRPFTFQRFGTTYGAVSAGSAATQKGRPCLTGGA
jgi:PAS domain-containing protein